MSNNCTTHHYACACREEQFKRIEEWALEAREALEHISENICDVECYEERALKVLAKFPGEKK